MNDFKSDNTRGIGRTISCVCVSIQEKLFVVQILRNQNLRLISFMNTNCVFSLCLNSDNDKCMGGRFLSIHLTSIHAEFVRFVLVLSFGLYIQNEYTTFKHVCDILCCLSLMKVVRCSAVCMLYRLLYIFYSCHIHGRLSWP